jgi:molybdopterin/thiamine biosynthesis adenylyltransferase
MSQPGHERLKVDTRQGRFHRHGLIGWWDQGRLSGATALVLGAGALGNEIIKNLCLLGFGQIRIVDLDTVENSNLSRSPLFRECHEGLPKAEAAAEGARDIYPNVKIAPMRANIVTELGWGHFCDADVILAGLDGREARLSANHACIRAGKLFFDGGIDGIAGYARVFDGRTGPCYECTMSERDWELVKRRRSCNMLSRDEMRSGHTPTVSTVSSVIAGLQVQQAVKHVHGLDVQPGSGLNVNGIAFDAWQIRYPANPECYAHDAGDEVVRMPWSAASTTAADVLDEGARRLGEPAVLDLRNDIMTRRECPKCGAVDQPLKTLASLGRGAALCATCGTETRWESSNQVEPGTALAPCTLAALGIPAYDMVRARSGLRSIDFVLDADRPDDWR